MSNDEIQRTRELAEKLLPICVAAGLLALCGCQSMIDHICRNC